MVVNRSQSILLATDLPLFGGAEVALVTVAEALAERAEVSVTCLVESPAPRWEPVLDRLQAVGVRVCRPAGPLRPSGLGIAVAAFRARPARRIARLLNKLQPDVVIVNLWSLWAGAAILDAARACRSVRVVAGYVQLGHPPSRLRARAGSLRDRLLPRHLRRFDLLLAVAQCQVDALRGMYPAERIRTVYQPVRAAGRSVPLSRVDARARLGVSAPQLIGVPGRIVFDHKGQDVAVRVARRLRDAGHDAHWAIVGDGPDREALNRLVTEAGLRERFHFCGWREDLESIMPAFDVVAMPSRYEGLPLTAVEAISAGVPVVASAVDGLVEIVPPPFAIAPGDEAGFAAVLGHLLHAPDTWPAAAAAQVRVLCDPTAVASRILGALNGPGSAV